ncbi:hypothetical protein [Pseudomonas sp. MPB26]|uniref:hypothetical protein n=1 Tax=Pseudomonas sp. MPB26 TaxID=3388491 RepID=UPI003984D38F
MSIGALAAIPLVGELAKTALPVVGEVAKAATELFKFAGNAVDSLAATQQSGANQNKIAQENTHCHHKPVDFSSANSASKNVNISVS